MFFKRLIFILVCFIGGLIPAAQAADCVLEPALAQSDFARLDFVDVTAAAAADPKLWQQYRDNLQNVQRIYKHDPSQSLIMLGYSALPDELAGDRGAIALLQQRLQRLRQSAKDNGYESQFTALPGTPVSAEFTATAMTSGRWPYRESGIEVITTGGCWAVFKFGTSQRGLDLAPDVRQEFLALRQRLAAPTSAVLSPLPADLDMQRLPPFHSDNFVRLVAITIIIALVIGLIISRAARASEGAPVQWFFRLLALAWLLYVVCLSIVPQWMTAAAYTPALEDFVYAGLMLMVAILGIMFGEIMELTAVALSIAHSVRSSLFLLLHFTDAPVIIWFDVGVLMLLALAVLVFGFRRHPQEFTFRHTRGVVDRQH